jgi:hypothetical protein
MSREKQHSHRKAHADMSVDERKRLPDSVFAFPKQRKEPLTDAEHVRNALARFDQVDGVTDTEREEAFARIKRAAKKFEVTMTATTWLDLGKQPQTENKSQAKKG